MKELQDDVMKELQDEPNNHWEVTYHQSKWDSHEEGTNGHATQSNQM